MSQRNLPPSFWRMNHQHHLPGSHLASDPAASTASSSTASFFMPPPPPALAGAQSTAPGHELYGADPYHASRYPVHHQNHDPWHYTLSNPAASPYSAHHRSAPATSMHDLGYTSASNRFNAQYSSLLLQPASMRSARLTPVSGSCSAFEKSTPDMSWLGARYHHDAINFASHHPIDTANYTASAAYGAAMSAAMSGRHRSFPLFA